MEQAGNFLSRALPNVRDSVLRFEGKTRHQGVGFSQSIFAEFINKNNDKR